MIANQGRLCGRPRQAAEGGTSSPDTAGPARYETDERPTSVSGPQWTVLSVARGTEVTPIDDVDGNVADETVQFALDGMRYEIDLSTKVVFPPTFSGGTNKKPM